MTPLQVRSQMGGRNVKVLVVENSPASVDAGSRYRVVTAASGREALEIAAAEQPQLILMDYGMPGWSGCQTRSVLAMDKRTEKIPFVIMTTESQAARLGPEIDHLLKPFGPNGFQTKLEQYLH